MGFQRILLFVIFTLSLMMLWGEWERQQNPVTEQLINQAAEVSRLPEVVQIKNNQKPQETKSSNVDGKKILVNTDIYKVIINTKGGDFEQVELLKHRDAADLKKSITLLQSTAGHKYVAQSGLLGNSLPTHNDVYYAEKDTYQLEEGASELTLTLLNNESNGVRVTKKYTFHRNSYQIDVVYLIENKGKTSFTASAYYQIVRDSSSVDGSSVFVPTYTGPAIYTEKEKFQKIEFAAIDKSDIDLPKDEQNGWVAMLQHYFVSAWIPSETESREFYAKNLGDNLYSIGLVMPIGEITQNSSKQINSILYVGPAQSKLDEIAPGLGYTVDYGWLTIFATPLFWLMSLFNDYVGNWGVAIILLTILIKLVFFPLSAASYRSMAKMRLVAPKLEQIKKQYGDDRERLNKAMMELYTSEKINPLGGCLPVLIQIPVFIALYWAILSSVELRHAPFIGWITDLSATDPYFILPIIMGISMIIQTKLNPVPPDPIQAKIMQIMPIAFSVVFFFFPAGLVLYSIVNNILSIGQQWYITYGETAGKTTAKAG